MTPSSASAPVFALVGANARPIPFRLEDVPGTPVGPEARIAGAAREAWGTALALRQATIAQDGYDPILVVCAVDCALGRQLVERAFGLLAPRSVSGPVVLPLRPGALEASFGAAGGKALAQELEALAPASGELRLLFAVNGVGVDLRVLRPLPPAAAAAAAPAQAEAPPSAASPPPPAPPAPRARRKR